MTEHEQIQQSVLDARQRKQSIEHKDWLENPVTRQMFKLIDGQLANIVSYIADNHIKGTDESLRSYAAQVKTLTTLKQVLHETEIFIARTNS